MTPLALELTLAIQADRLRGQQIERALHEAELARRRYLQVDPTNRLVAASLEADWNERLRAVTETRERVEHQRDADRVVFDGQTRQRIRELAADVPAVWDDPATPPRERKRILGLLLEDVTLARQDDEITLAVRFRGGATTTLRVPLRSGPWRGRKTLPRSSRGPRRCSPRTPPPRSRRGSTRKASPAAPASRSRPTPSSGGAGTTG